MSKPFLKKQLKESERDELERLRKEVAELTKTNDILLQSIHTLSGDLLKRRNVWNYSDNFSIPTKKIKNDSVSSIDSHASTISTIYQTNHLGIDDDVGLPNEIMLHLFKNLCREDLDNCSLVCRRWKRIIDKHESKLSRRNIRLLKIYENGNNTGTIIISAETETKNLKFSLNFSNTQHQPDPAIRSKITQMLSYSYIRRCIMCGFELKGIIALDLFTIFKKANIKFHRLELIGLSLRLLPADTFHRLIGEQVNAEQYFIDGMRNADPDHFNSKLFEKPSITLAEDITVFDVTSMNDDDVILDINDDILLDFMFGKNSTSTERSSIYLDSPGVSQSFVHNTLVKFTQETNFTHSLPHAEFSHCRPQIVHSCRNVKIEYDTEVQTEWTAYNKQAHCVLEAKISRTPDDNEFVHLMFNIIHWKGKWK